MVFKVKLLPTAKTDLEKALDYYHTISPFLAKKFYSGFLELNAVLEDNPFFELRYQTIRTCNLKKFPYLVHFIIDESTKTVTIIAIVFGKRKKTNFAYRLDKPQ